MIEAYYQEIIKVSDIVTSLGSLKQIIYNVINYLKEEHFAYDYYNRYKIIPLYKKAVAKYGKLAHDECFGFVPLLALGGFKDVDHMDKVKVLEHIYLMY